MKKIIFTLLLGFTLIGFSQSTAIPDTNFEQALIDLGYDTAPINGSVPTANINSVTDLSLHHKNIADLTGIEDFTDLIYLNLYKNQLTSLDVSNNNALTELDLYNNQLTNLDVSKNPALTWLGCSDNKLTSLDVSNNTALQILYCDFNQLTSLDVSNNNALQILYCYNNQLTSLDLGNITTLTNLDCFNNQLTSLDVSNNNALISFQCANNQLTSLDVSSCIYWLSYLNCDNNQLTSLDVRNRNNPYFRTFTSTNNPDLICIFVDDASYSTTNWTNIDPASAFVTNEAACAALSLGDTAFELDVSIYPNPASEMVCIDGNYTQLKVVLYNVLGKEVLSVKNTNNINVQALPSGVYTIRISDGVGQTNRKFIKN